MHNRVADRFRFSSLHMMGIFVLALLFGAGASAQPAASADEAYAAAHDRAVEIVQDAADADDARQRMAALEASMSSPDLAATLAQRGLSDDNPAVRFASLVLIGRLEIERLGAAAVDLMEDENASVRAAAIFAAMKCGREVDPSPLGQMLGSNIPGNRANAAMLLGLMGDPGALPMLGEMSALPMPRVDPEHREWVRVQFAEAMLRLDPNDEEVLSTVRAAALSNYDAVRVLAFQIISEVGDATMVPWMERVLGRDNPVQVRVSLARALAEFGSLVGTDVLFGAAAYSAEDVKRDAEQFLSANAGGAGREVDLIRALIRDVAAQRAVAADIRSQAALGLGALGGERAAGQVVAMLEDEAPGVRLAAATVVLQAAQ